MLQIYRYVGCFEALFSEIYVTRNNLKHYHGITNLTKITSDCYNSCQRLRPAITLTHYIVGKISMIAIIPLHGH
jgi:hypothetical protein